MITTSRKQKDRYGFTRLGWPPAIAHSGVEYICTRHIEATSGAPTFEALRRGFHTCAPLDIPGTSWLAMLRAVLGNPAPGPTRAAAGQGVLLRLIIAEPLSGLLTLDATMRIAASATRGSSPRSTSKKATTSAARPFEMLLDPQINADALTWAANANKAQTSAFDSSGQGFEPCA